MKYAYATLLALSLLLSISCRAATPSFTDFDQTQFNTNGLKIRMPSGLPLTNLNLRIRNGSTGIQGAQFGTGWLWLNDNNEFLYGFAGSSLVVYTNFDLRGPFKTVFTNAILVTDADGFVAASSANSFVQSLNGAATNLAVVGSVTIGESPGSSIFLLPELGHTTNLYVGISGGRFVVQPTYGMELREGAYIGDGGGLTNLQTLTNVTQNVTIHGKVTLNSNVYIMSMFWFTNAMSTITINAAKSMEALATNNNISITGYSGIDGTNGNAFTRVFTNTAGASAVKTITLPAGTLVLSSPFSTTIYNTNQGVLSGVIYPGFGTNVSWIGN